jgi:HD superfamily phosphodiesterase
MIAYFKGDAKRVQHFLKVYSFAKIIGEGEQLEENRQFILETAAIVHDIGIRQGELQLGRNDGKIQEELGPEEARKLLVALHYAPNVIDRVCYLVGHHHTYTHIDEADYQILVEADFIVNAYEDDCGVESNRNIYEHIFKTKTGREVFQSLYGK